MVTKIIMNKNLIKMMLKLKIGKSESSFGF